MNRRLLLAVILAGAAMAPISGYAQPIAGGTTELSLYGVPLKDASVVDFVAAAKKAGVKAAGRGEGGLPKFSAKAAGVPALESFELLADAGKVVTVQFKVIHYGEANELLRKMLVQKYGNPLYMSRDLMSVSLEPKAKVDDRFDGQYDSTGDRYWQFAGGMKLIYSKKFAGETTLSYTNEEAFNGLLSRVEKAANKGASDKAAAVKSNF